MNVRSVGATWLAASALAIGLGSVSTTPASAQECEVKIGMAGALTGAASAWGLAMKGATEFVAAQTLLAAFGVARLLALFHGA